MNRALSIIIFIALYASQASADIGGMGPIPVDIVVEEGRYALHRGGEPYYIKGAGGRKFFKQIVGHGGNSIRTWSASNALEILDKAHALGLTVTLGLWVSHEQYGFDYNDRRAVAEQLAEFKAIVEEVKDHPALLMWGIGNEVNLKYNNIKVWDAVQDIAKMIHELDGNHPTMTVIAGMPRKDIELVKRRCPDIDVLGINVYGQLLSAADKLRENGWNGPYVVTEWGPNGPWEVATTKWRAPLELTSSEKAQVVLDRYEGAILKDTEHCLGAYVFYWGNKSTPTPTWYSLFLESGERTSVAGVMRYLWRGSWPENRAPNVSHLVIDSGTEANRNLYLTPGMTYHATVSAEDPEGDPLSAKWAIWRESERVKIHSDGEDLSEALVWLDKNNISLSFSVPEKPGAYRLYTLVFDGNNNVAVAGKPFFVR